MASITVTREIGGDPAVVWALLADFGDVSWIPLAEGVVVEGSGPGMRRTIQGPEGPPVVERLIAIESGRRTLTYSIDENNPLPVQSYEATVRVSSAGAAGSAIIWDVSFEPRGDVAAAQEAITAIYGLMATWLEAAASAPSRPGATGGAS